MEFRFGVNMLASDERTRWLDKCRKAEDLGFDVVATPDHLGMPAPFPSLVAAAGATERVRLTTFVVNTAFYNPTLLAREVDTTDLLLDGRLELGLGTGYARTEFDEAGLPFPGPGARLDHLERCLAVLREHYRERKRPPIVLGGQRDRMLRIAAREADVVGFTGAHFNRDGDKASLAGLSELDERVAFVRTAAGDRDPELNMLVQHVDITDDRAAGLERIRPYDETKSAEELGELPMLLVGTAGEIADRLRAHRERFGFSYITVMEKDMDTFASVIDQLR
ncbi:MULTISPECIES: TIGR03621 family F420-dependent LLM class oxidoreductase [Prauserella salsuginis group]|uniref:TIGR03621 family F420-dependent LLM class oxidoreductase n=1 Tax=Prauserella salsuginis TaxID=387889 RepID=A0ABW6FZ60_9PSEU|nr:MULTISPECIES: TIGR03621 family F420-dependent LLM class oxidoreductase [Prauserella salsuginis group]MCR3720520.1 putative F420-dependent oxidoreductase, MSMEG_2516 family [Prauserella flava]MCR3733770.1 putative F420-dependent oxidoreductase, MSMEG_2516 family [Prauserella salsuginis]